SDNVGVIRSEKRRVLKPFYKVRSRRATKDVKPKKLFLNFLASDYHCYESYLIICIVFLQGLERKGISFI
ncbi:hypothetical protein, partial [Pseudoalteromonas rubra]|uniref:hypothetical protein n=1 Tax=Pseudoalteromonas rubra TaxID=43658 RepID=UPI0019825DBB